MTNFWRFFNTLVRNGKNILPGVMLKTWQGLKGQNTKIKASYKSLLLNGKWFGEFARLNRLQLTLSLKFLR